MRRSLLAISIFSLLTATSLFASSAQSDLLSKATDGAIATAKADSVKVLSNDEMGEVKGGVANPILVNAGRAAIVTISARSTSSIYSNYLRTVSIWPSLIRVK